eukprot:1421282-Alexandrium_andersonii.AAC.1
MAEAQPGAAPVLASAVLHAVLGLEAGVLREEVAGGAGAVMHEAVLGRVAEAPPGVVRCLGAPRHVRMSWDS